MVKQSIKVVLQYLAKIVTIKGSIIEEKGDFVATLGVGLFANEGYT